MRIDKTVLGVVFGLGLLTASVVQGADAVKVEGGILTNAAGMSLYTFDKDTGGKSACTGSCTTNWPPMMAGPSDKASGDYSIISRDDGSKQWAYKGKPLYLWSKDQKPGDTTGDGRNNIWHLAKP